MEFSDKLKKGTEANHKILDRHKFVKNIGNKTGGYYVDLHNIILNEIKLIICKTTIEFPEYFHRFNKNYNKYRLVTNDDLYNSDSMNKYLQKLNEDSNDKELLLSHMYIWWLGVLYGGQMIKKVLQSYNSRDEFKEYICFIFDSDNRVEFIKKFKMYLNEHVQNEDTFIRNVNILYIFVNDLFNELDNKIEEK